MTFMILITFLKFVCSETLFWQSNIYSMPNLHVFKIIFHENRIVDSKDFLSYDIASGNDITSCLKMDKRIVKYILKRYL